MANGCVGDPGPSVFPVVADGGRGMALAVWPSTVLGMLAVSLDTREAVEVRSSTDAHSSDVDTMEVNNVRAGMMIERKDDGELGDYEEGVEQVMIDSGGHIRSRQTARDGDKAVAHAAAARSAGPKNVEKQEVRFELVTGSAPVAMVDMAH
jgi:hypothetical protein